MPASRKPTHRIVDVNPAKELEVSWVPKGSNPLAKIILRKAAEQPETTNMLKSVALAKILTTGGAAAAYVATFAKEEELDAYLAKDEAGQKADVDGWVQKTGWKVPETPQQVERAAKPAAGDDNDADDKVAKALAKALEESPLVKGLQAANEELKKRLEGFETSATVTTLEKRAITEFKGLSIGVEKTVAILKALPGIAEEEVRKDVEGLMKAHAELCQRVAKTSGLRADITKADSAFGKLQKMAEEVAKSDKISFEEAMYKVSNDPANAELVERADAEAAGED
jgi:hypothetical protein